jgi:hypothetical protein
MVGGRRKTHGSVFLQFQLVNTSKIGNVERTLLANLNNPTAGLFTQNINKTLSAQNSFIKYNISLKFAK